MATPNFDPVIDDRLLLNTGAKTATGAGSVAYIDLGASPLQWIGVRVNVTAMDIVSNDELYKLVIQGSPDSAFTAATIQELGQISLSAKEVKETDSDQDDFIGVRFFAVLNQGLTAADTPSKYRYIRLYYVISGTTPTITAEVHAVPLPGAY